MNFNENPYYSPDKCGLEIFESIDTADSYEFNMFVIWKKIDDHTLWWSTDSGCSCPTPFENCTTLNPITIGNFRSFDDSLKNHDRISNDDYMRISSKVIQYVRTEGLENLI